MFRLGYQQLSKLLMAGLIAGSLAACATDDGLTDADADRGDIGAAPLYGMDEAEVIDGEYIVVFKDSASLAGMTSTMQEVSLASADNYIKDTFTIIPGFSAKLSDGAVEELRNDPSVAYIEANRMVTLDTVHANPTWGLDRIDQRTGLSGSFDDLGMNGAGVHAYVIDSGIRSSHSEFTGRIGEGFSAIQDGRGVEDCNGHGTHVASTVAGTSYGVAKAATIHPVRIFGCTPRSSWDVILSGINWVAENATLPAVANLSLGGGGFTPVDDAIQSLIDAGVITVVSAGNENQDACLQSPARTPAALTVAASDRNDRRADFSNFGRCVDLFGPGVDVVGASFRGDAATVSMNGTSMAAPHVSGVAALYLQSKPGATPAEVHQAIVNAATPNVVTDPQGSPNRLLFGGSDLIAKVDPLEVFWARNPDGSYRLHALPGDNVQTVKYYVDNIFLRESTRQEGANFPATYTFSLEKSERLFEARGFDSAGKQVALGVGLMDVTPSVGVFIRQLGTGYYDIGLERAPDGVAYIEVRVDNFLLTDEITGRQQSERDIVRYRFQTLGTRQVAISTYNADGTLRGTLRRNFTFR